jgi:hypothetical protein
MDFFKTASGDVVNLSHVVMVRNENNNPYMLLLGMAQPLEITQEDFDSFTQIASYSEAKLMLNVMEFSPLTFDQSIRMLTELMLHFVAHSIATQNGTLKDFPTTMVYERIANLMHIINTSEYNDNQDNNESEEQGGQ